MSIIPSTVFAGISDQRLGARRHDLASRASSIEALLGTDSRDSVIHENLRLLLDPIREFAEMVANETWSKDEILSKVASAVMVYAAHAQLEALLLRAEQRGLLYHPLFRATLRQIASLTHKIKESADGWFLRIVGWGWKDDALKKVVQSTWRPQEATRWSPARPTLPAVESAFELVALTENEDLSMPIVLPTLDGGIQFEWTRGDRELEVEVRPDGAVFALESLSGEPAREWEIGQKDVPTLFEWLMKGADGGGREGRQRS